MMQQQAGQQAQQAPQQQQAAAGGAMPDVMTPAQAAGFVQVTEADIMAAIEAGALKARKIGTAYRITKASLEEFLGG
jgi:excisionase family DNA binding protein